MAVQPIHEASPQPGYYKMRRHRNGPWLPVAIWRKDGELLCAVGVEKKATDAREIWTYCAANKVDKDAAKHAFEKGWWPDQPPPIGDNLPPPDDPYEALKAEIEAKQKQATDWLGARPAVLMQKDADYAANAQRELLALNKRADAMFTAEKAPHLAAGRACDERYRFRSAVADVAEKLRKVFGKFMAEEEARQNAEAAAKFKAEQDRIAKERADKLARDPVAALTDPAPELPLAPEPVKVQVGGGVGRRAGLRTVWVPTVTDYQLAAMHYLNHPDLRAVVDKLVKHAVRDAKGSIVIPGVTIREDREAA